MIGFVEKVIAYTEELPRNEFENSGLNYDATVQKLELIGEAATHIPEDVCHSNLEIAWRQLIATRNRLIHGYVGIDNEPLWSIIKDDIPILSLELRKLKDQVG